MEAAKLRSKALRASLASPFSKRETERAAWYYEAEKRLTGAYRFGKPFPSLTYKQMREAVHIWGCDQKERHAANPAVTVPDSEDTPSDHGHSYWPRISVNLETSDKAIFRELAKHFDKVRKERHIKPSKRGPRQGINPHKGEAWEQIEAFDKERGLNDSDRKQKSEMSRKYYERTPRAQLPLSVRESSAYKEYVQRLAKNASEEQKASM